MMGLTSLLPSLATGPREGAYELEIQDLSMRSVPWKSTLTPASSMAPAEVSFGPGTFLTCSIGVYVEPRDAQDTLFTA